MAEEYPEKIQFLTKQLNRIIVRGRTTDGPAQKNDRAWWSELNWMTKEEYEELGR
ncbi:MAG: hypothetical protein NE328_21770 [Lentisphaeraceae bacterium]|nr:hypothetical protein [Lentisphaeraceae bacterium]